MKYVPLSTSTGTFVILIDSDLLETIDDDFIGLNAKALLNNAMTTITTKVLYMINMIYLLTIIYTNTAVVSSSLVVVVVLVEESYKRLFQRLSVFFLL